MMIMKSLMTMTLKLAIFTLSSTTKFTVFRISYQLNLNLNLSKGEKTASAASPRVILPSRRRSANSCGC